MKSKDVTIGMLVKVDPITDEGKTDMEIYKSWLNRHGIHYTPYFYVKYWSSYRRMWILEHRVTSTSIWLSSKDFENVVR